MAADILSFLRRIGAERSVTHVVAQLLRYAGQTFDVHRVSLFVADERTGRLRPFLSEFPSGSVHRELFEEWRTLDFEPAEVIRRIRAGEDVVRVDDPGGPGGFPGPIAERYGLRPFLALALRNGETLEAVLMIEADEEQLAPLLDDALLLRDHLALALENARAYEREAVRAAEAEALLEVTKVLARTTELTPVLVAVARQSAKVSGFERCSIFLVDEDAERLVPTMSQFADGHADAEAWERFITNDADLPAAWEVLRTRQPIVVERAEDRPDLLPPDWFEPFGIATLVYVPLVAWDECFGVLVLDHRRTTAITEQQLAMATAVAGQGAVAIGVGRLLERLRRSNEDLARADRAKDDFLSMLSHELRNPVTSILGFTATLERGWDRLDPERRTDLLQRIQANAERQDRMIDDLLQSSRIVSGDLEPRIRTVPLGPLVEDAVALLHLPAGCTDLRVDGQLVRADPDHVRQIVSNLLTNAQKYGRPPFVLTTSRAMEGRVRLEVRDQGDGVPENFLPHLFQPFTQARRKDDTTSGVGLGLSIARRMAQASGGDLRYEPDGSGAVFVLELPAGATGRQREA